MSGACLLFVVTKEAVHVPLLVCLAVGVAAELRMVHAELQAIAAEQVQEGPSQQRAELAGSTPMQRRERRGSQPNEAARRMPEPVGHRSSAEPSLMRS